MIFRALCRSAAAFGIAFGIVGLASTVVSCSDEQATSDVKFDAAHSVALSGTVDEGRIVATSSNVDSIKAEIKEQLWYTVGQFNGLNGVPDLNRLQTTVNEVTPRADGSYDVKYAANLFISWPREVQVPANLELVMPARGDYQGLQNFYDAFGSDEAGAKQCMAWEAHEVSLGIFWYYYRPAKSSCPLVNRTRDDQAVVARFNIRLSLSNENTTGKFPEYAKVWEDGRLVVTAIFGKNEDGATDDWDAGIAAFRQTYDDLRATYGQPVSDSLPTGQRPSNVNDDVRLTFNTASGVLDVHLYLVDGIRSVGPDFRVKYNERTQISDFVSYSGHSGLGANIRALARMGQFVPGQYQIFLVNGCDTFAYVESSLQKAHHAANPAFGPDKFYDMITNAMPSYFHMNSTANMKVVNGLVGKTQSYRQILAGFDQAQRAAVTGEQDNAWPQPF